MWVRIAFPNDLSNYNHWLYQGIVSCRETFQTEAFVFQFQLWEAPNVPYLSQLRDFARVFIPTIPIILPFFLQLRLGRLQPVSCWQLIHGKFLGNKKTANEVKTIWAQVSQRLGLLGGW